MIYARSRSTLAHYGVRDCAHEVTRVSPGSVPEADAIVATSFETAEWVSTLPPRAGVQIYFLQDYEAWTPDLEPRVDATWRLPFVRVVISRWLVKLGRERLGVECRGPVGNGVDTSRLRPAEAGGAGAPRSLTVGAVYDTRPGKAAEDLVEALQLIAKTRPDTRFLIFGRYRLRHRLPVRARYVRNPALDLIPHLYRRMNVFLHASRREGWGLPPMEAMASGCAVVATLSGGVQEFADASSARLVPPGAPIQLASAALELLDAPLQRQVLAREARERMLGFTWAAAYARFEEELFRAATGGGAC